MRQKRPENFEQNNKEIALNVLFVPHNNKKEIELVYKSKCNYKRKN